MSFALLSSGCAKAPDAEQEKRKVFTNGKVYTVNENQPWAEAVAVVDNRIAYVGDNAGAKSYINENTEVFDLNGKMLMPGFVSGHDHLVAAEWMFNGINLFPGASKEEYHQLIRDYVEAHPDEEVIVGMGWNVGFYGDYPTAKELDELVPDRPAILIDYTVHEGWLNTRAMEIAGIDRSTPDPIPGISYFKRDADGNPTGTAIEFAWADAYVKSGAWKPEETIRSSQKNLYGAAVKTGMTSVMLPGIVTPNLMFPEPMFADYRIALRHLASLKEQGKLQLRSFVLPFLKHPDTDPDSFVATTLALKAQYDSDMLRIQGVKVHPEGTWSGASVLMLEPWADNPDSRGGANLGAEEMKQIILAANAAGLDVHTHVEGDGSARNWIDAIEATRAAGNSDARNSLQHLMLVHPDDLERIKRLQIPVNVTPLFSIAWGGQDVNFDRMVGHERVQAEVSRYPELFDSGNKVSLSADMVGSPMEYMGGLVHIQIAMTQKDPFAESAETYPKGRKGVSLEQAIKGVTIYPAWQMRMEGKIGSIEVGKYADLVVLDKNLFETPVEEISNVHVIGTILDGEFTHRDGI